MDERLSTCLEGQILGLKLTHVAKLGLLRPTQDLRWLGNEECV